MPGLKTYDLFTDAECTAEATFQQVYDAVMAGLVLIRRGDAIYMPSQAIIQKDDDNGELLGITFVCNSFQASVSNSAGE